MYKPGDSNFSDIASRQIALLFENVSKNYEITTGQRLLSLKHNPEVVTALREINLIIHEGDSVGLVGRNGSGKSTLLRLASGAENPTDGNIFGIERPVLLGVTPALQQWLTGKQNIHLGCLALGMSEEEVKEEAPKIGEWTGLGDALDRPMSTYSSGMAAKVTFAISTSIRPKILLVDEALSTGDATFRTKAKKRTEELLENAGTLILVSHSPAQVTQLCKDAIWIESGEIITSGTAQEIGDMYQNWTDMLDHQRFDEASDFLRGIRKEYNPPSIMVEK